MSLVIVFCIIVSYTFALKVFGGPVVELFNGAAKKKNIEKEAFALALLQITAVVTSIILVMTR